MESSGAQRKTRETNSCTIRRTVTRQSSKQPRWERAGNLWREGRARTEGGAEAADEGEGERHQHVRLHFRRGSALLLGFGGARSGSGEGEQRRARYDESNQEPKGERSIENSSRFLFSFFTY
jgi:hypothetical protein